MLCVSVGCESIVTEELPSYEDTSLVSIGERAPNFKIEALDGNMLTIREGEVSLLILFSHTCPDCINLMSDLQQYIDAGGEHPSIIAVSRGGTREQIEEFAAEHNLTFPIAADEQKDIYYQYATMYVPRCYIIDNEGIIRYITYEYRDGDIDTLMDYYHSL